MANSTTNHHDKSKLSLPSKGKPKREAKMFSSCDACKLRKIKCDRRERVLHKRSSNGESLNLEEFSQLDIGVSCSPCTSRGLQCIFSQTPGIKTRKGKILRTLHEKQESLHSVNSKSSSSLERERSVTSCNSSSSNPTAGSGSGFASESQSLSLISGDVISILGLSEATVEDCISSFFAWSEPSCPLIPRDIFNARYKRHREQVKNGIKIPSVNDANELFDSYDEPISEFWILAVLICGSGALTSEMADYPRRFQIQQDLGRLFRDRLFSSGGIERLVEDDLDALEALFLLWSADFSLPSHEEIDSRSLISRNHSSHFVISVTSLEGIMKLAERIGLTSRADRKIIKGRFLSAREMERRTRPFFYLHWYDSVTSFLNRTSLRWSNDDFSHGIPEFLHEPGKSDEMELENLMGQFSSPLFQLHFGAAWSMATMKLCFLIRKWHPLFVSARAQQMGIDSGKLMECLEVLESFPNEIPNLAQWDYLLGFIDGDGISSLPGFDPSPVIPGTETHSNLMKALQVKLGQHSPLLSLAETVALTGFKRSGLVDSWEIALAKFKLEQALTSALERIVTVIRQALPLRLLRGNIRIVRVCLEGFIWWGCRKIDASISELQDSSTLVQMVESLKILLQGVESAGEMNAENPNLVSRLQEAINVSMRKVEAYVDRNCNRYQSQSQNRNQHQAQHHNGNQQGTIENFNLSFDPFIQDGNLVEIGEALNSQLGNGDEPFHIHSDPNNAEWSWTHSHPPAFE